MTTSLNEMPAPSVLRADMGAGRSGHGRLGLELRCRTTGAGTVTVTVRGELDIATADHMYEYVRMVIDRPSQNVILDLSDLTFCDCRGISCLIRLDRHAATTGSFLRLSGLRPAVATILRVSGVEHRFSIVERPAEDGSALLTCPSVDQRGRFSLAIDLPARPAVTG